MKNVICITETSTELGSIARIILYSESLVKFCGFATEYLH